MIPCSVIEACCEGICAQSDSIANCRTCSMKSSARKVPKTWIAKPPWLSPLAVHVLHVLNRWNSPIAG